MINMILAIRLQKPRTAALGARKCLCYSRFLQSRERSGIADFSVDKISASDVSRMWSPDGPGSVTRTWSIHERRSRQASRDFAKSVRVRLRAGIPSGAATPLLLRPTRRGTDGRFGDPDRAIDRTAEADPSRRIQIGGQRQSWKRNALTSGMGFTIRS